jgi:phosphohistidine phosphatase SixA
MLKKLFIIRHGNYGPDERLNATGVSQMENLVPILKSHITEHEKVIILSSSAPRAEDSAKVISKGMGIAFEKHSEFWSDEKHHQDNRRAKLLLEQKTKERMADTIILITHCEYAKELAWYIALSMQFNAKRKDVDEGGMVYLNREKKTSVLIEN